MPLHTYVHVCYVFGAEKLKVDHLIIIGKQIFILIPSESFIHLVFSFTISNYSSASCLLYIRVQDTNALIDATREPRL